jgi:hypothetical protein
MHGKEKLKKSWRETGKALFLKKSRNHKSDNLSDLLEKDKAIWSKAFDQENKKEKVVICADERVIPRKGEFKIGIAGQMILAGKKDKDNFTRNWKGKIRAVRGHDGCGAAGVAYSKLSKTEKSRFLIKTKEEFLDYDPRNRVSDADLYGAYHSYLLAKELDAEFEYIGFSEMRGEKEFHDARGIFWSADPTFDPTDLLKDNYLPPHFLANGLAFGLSEKYCREELKILTGIALGNHGFEKLFNKNPPFYVVNVGKNLEEAKKMSKIARNILGEHKDKIAFKYLST